MSDIEAGIMLSFSLKAWSVWDVEPCGEAWYETKKEFVDAACSMHIGLKVVLVHHILISQVTVSARKSYVE